jgi:hypothetical protein
MLSGLVPGEYVAVMPDSRRVSMYTWSEEITVGPWRVRTLVHAAATVDRKLAGRAFLREFVAILDGPRAVLAMSTPPAGELRSRPV